MAEAISSGKIRVVLADDHEVFLEGLSALVAGEDDLDIVGVARNGSELLRLLPTTEADLVVTDLSMPGLNGLEAVRRIASEHPDTKVVCLTMHSAPHFVEEALAGGASGYVLKHNAFDEVIRAIYAVHRGHVFVTSEVTGALVESWRAKREEEVSAFNLLTERERDVLQLLAEGLSTHEIGERLHLSIKTVGTHRQHIMEKTGIRSIAGLTKYAVAEGLTELESLE